MQEKAAEAAEKPTPPSQTAAKGTIRLALCITELECGGAERCLVEIARRLDRRRFQPKVYCLGPPPADPRNSCVAPLHEAGIEVELLGARSIWSAPLTLQKLTRLWRRDRPDLVLTFLFHANVLGRIAARRAGAGRVISGIRVAERSARWHVMLDRWTSRLVNHYVCVSDAVAEFTRDVLRLPGARITVIPNGVDVERFAAAAPVDLRQFGVPASRRVMTFIGRLEEQKGADWLIEIAPQLLANLPAHDLLLVGQGPLEKDLHRRCTQLEIAERVHFAGWRGNIPEILAGSDLSLLPSRWEGMPNVVLEAMAAARPVVATDVEGVRQLLGPASDAQVVPPGDAQAFIKKSVAIASQTEEAARLGAENRRRAEQNFSLDAMVDAYAGLFERLLDG